MSTDNIKFRCFEIKQPIGSFYVGILDGSDLFKISKADIRRMKDRKIETFTGIQRPLKPNRVAEIKKYVTNVDACFPTSVILAVRSEHATYNRDTGIMSIVNEKDVAEIIDGQHRIAGFEDYEGTFQIVTTIFVDMDEEDMAMQFATVNLKQTKVNKSLAYDLYEYTKSRSPQKSSHNIAVLFNRKDGSPFKGMIKILGVASGKENETITQATFIEHLLKLISEDPMDDRDKLKRGKKLSRIDNPLEKKQIFRNMFVDEEDAKIAKILWNYFGAVKQKWPKAWPEKQAGNILNRTAGFGSLMKFLRDVYVSMGKEDAVTRQTDFFDVFKKIKIRDEDFNPDVYKPGSSGASELYKHLLSKSGIKE